MLTAVLLATLTLAIPQLTAQTEVGCDPNLAAAGLCGANTGTEIVIDGTQQTDPVGTPPVTNDWVEVIDAWWPPATDEEWIPPQQVEFDRCLAAWDSDRPCFVPSDDEEATEDEGESDEERGMPPITITDLARFAPDGTLLTGEPDNVGVAGLPTNFVADASVQTVTGELFGYPISVRFTPAAFDFAFGDGATLTTTTGGQSWDALDQAQFTPTDTSHTYAERGTYTARVNVRYTAEVDFGIGWLPITGEVTSPGAPQEVRIFEAHTALVAHTCQQAPSSPGC